MKTEALKELVELCHTGDCTVQLEASKSGIVAIVRAHRNGVSLQTSVYLDRNDTKMGEGLQETIDRVK